MIKRIIFFIKSIYTIIYKIFKKFYFNHNKEKRIMIMETNEEYLEILKNRPSTKDQWIYDILDGKAEQEDILYKNNLFLIIPTDHANSSTKNKLHILAIPTDITLRTLRNLRAKDIPLLEMMKQKTLEIIKEKFNLEEHSLKMYFHYRPSTYHLHIHFVNIDKRLGSSVEYSHDLDLVIYNLKIKDNYYEDVILKKVQN